MKAALYARVSTQLAQDPVMQLRELRDYCERRGWDVAGEYTDVGISGARERRPELDRLVAQRYAFSPCDIRERSGSCPDLRKFRIIAVRGDGPVLLIGLP